MVPRRQAEQPTPSSRSPSDAAVLILFRRRLEGRRVSPSARVAEEWLDGTYAAEILVTRSLMIWNAAIYCTQVARNALIGSVH